MKTIAIALLASLVGTQPSQPAYRLSSTAAIGTQTNTIMNQQSAALVVREFLTAVQQNNFEKAVSLLHPNVTWNQPGNNRFSGIKTSRDELVGMIGGMVAFSAKSLTITRFNQLSVNGNRVACTIHWQAVEEAGGRLDVDNIDVYTVVNGQITEATVYSADLAHEDTFWPK